MKFEHMYERMQPQMMILAKEQGGLITLAQLRKIIMYYFGSDERTIKRKMDALTTFRKIEPDAEPGQFFVTDYRPKAKRPDNGNDGGGE